MINSPNLTRLFPSPTQFNCVLGMPTNFHATFRLGPSPDISGAETGAQTGVLACRHECFIFINKALNQKVNSRLNLFVA